MEEKIHWRVKAYRLFNKTRDKLQEYIDSKSNLFIESDEYYRLELYTKDTTPGFFKGTKKTTVVSFIMAFGSKDEDIVYVYDKVIYEDMKKIAEELGFNAIYEYWYDE